MKHSKPDKDSLRIELMLQICRKEMHYDISKSLKYCERATKLASKKKDKFLEAKAIDTKGILYCVSGRYIDAIQYFRQSIKIFDQLDEEIGYSKSLGNLAATYQYAEDFENALLYQLKSLQISEKLQDSVSMCTSYLNLGNIHMRLENIERAKNYLKKSFQISLKLDQPVKQMEALNSLSLSLMELKQFEEAIKYNNLSIQIAEKNKLEFNRYMALDVLGRIQLAQKQYLKAKNNFLLVKPEFENSGYEYLVISNYHFIGESYLGLNQMDSAAFYFHKTLEIGVPNEYNVHVINAYKGLTKLYIQLSEKDSAVFYFNKVLEYNIDYLNSQKTTELERLQTVYETNKKEKEIRLLSQQARLKDALLVKRNYFIVILVLVLVLLTLGILFSYKFLKLKQRERTNELEHKALRAQMNPHFLFNSLNSIQRMYMDGKVDEANEYMADFADLIRKVLENSNYNLITIHLEIEMLKLYLHLEQMRCKNNFEFQIQMDEKIDTHQITVPPLIFQPFVENSIWHGILPINKKGLITIKIIKYKNLLNCSVTDNGVGFSLQNHDEHVSHGITITEKRIGSKVKIVSSENEGTEVYFTLKLKE